MSVSSFPGQTIIVLHLMWPSGSSPPRFLPSHSAVSRQLRAFRIVTLSWTFLGSPNEAGGDFDVFSYSFHHHGDASRTKPCKVSPPRDRSVLFFLVKPGICFPMCLQGHFYVYLQVFGASTHLQLLNTLSVNGEQKGGSVNRVLDGGSTKQTFMLTFMFFSLFFFHISILVLNGVLKLMNIMIKLVIPTEEQNVL